MKRWICAALAAMIMVAALAGCAGGPGTPAGSSSATGAPTAAALLETLAAACGADPDADRITMDSEDPDLALWAQASYGLAAELWTDGAILLPQGAQATELAVFRLANGSDADALISALEDYRLSRQGDFTGYAPEQAQLAAQSLTVQVGDWVALLLCADAELAAQTFADCLGADGQEISVPAGGAAGGDAVVLEGRYPYTPPGKDDMTCYDTTAILSAWNSGEDAGLSAKDRAILDQCRAVIGQIITEGMIDYEKESAVYRWVTTHGEYDNDHYSSWAQMDPDSYTPYGLLVNGKGVCLSFASTFQLFMDLLDVECVTVVGAAFQSQEDHAWNMVRLDGEWYCVDPTWDLNNWDGDEGSDLEYIQQACCYFNVTSQYMADTDHQWDYSAVPEATAEDGGRPAGSSLPAEGGEAA